MAVTVKYLSNVTTTEELIESTVATVRSRYKGAFSMPDDVTAFINGESVGNEEILEDGDVIEFRKSHGEKGN